MINYKKILKTYGIKEYNFFCFSLLRLINERIDATALVYEYIDSVKKRSLKRYIYRRKLVRKYGIFIEEHTSISEGLRLPHPVDIVIGDGVKIGDNVTIFQNVTLGSKGIGLHNYPVVERECIIFSGAKILGDIRLGESCIIGANSVLNTTTEPHSVYVGVPARKIK